MSRSYESTDIVVLPRMDAATAVALASALEGAAATQLQQGATLPDAIAEARADMATDCAALQSALGSAPPPEAMVRGVDLREDAAASALVLLCQAWARLAGEVPEGDIARFLTERLFADGLEFTNYKTRKEWSVVDTKLKIIDDEKLESKFAQLGALPMLTHLRGVHVLYGEATGMTKPVPAAESPLVGEKRIALMESVKHYVVTVNGSIRRKVPATRQLATELLKPLAQWQSEPTKPTPKQQ